MRTSQPVPYCGSPPVPDELWSSWNGDPVLLACLGLATAWVLPRARGHERSATLVGIAVVAAATVSPLCRLAVALFSARMAQHLALVVVAAPLLAVYVVRNRRVDSAGHAGGTVPAALAFATCLWCWHAPVPYAMTLRSSVVYWTAHLSLLLSAAWLWSVLLARRPDDCIWQVGVAMWTFVHMGLLGALLTVAPEPLFAPHLHTTRAWGLSPTEDQQLGGLLCWIPGGAAFLAVGLGRTAAAMRGAVEPAARL